MVSALESRKRGVPIAQRQLTVFVRELELLANVGVYEHERGRRQPLVFNVAVILADNEKEGIESTFDYDEIVEAIKAILAQGHHPLLEGIARLICAQLFCETRIEEVSVTITKPRALGLAKYAGITLSVCR